MSQLKIATFNLENLFSRHLVLDDPGAEHGTRFQLVGIASIDYQGGELSDATTQAQRNHTARAILDCQPDILAVQEVEDLWTLRCFNDQYLSGYFDRMILIEGNDGRGIDVGLCLRAGCDAQVRAIRTHADELDPSAEHATRVNRYFSESRGEIVVENALFSRDCLEVELDAQGRALTLLVNHFKAQESGSGGDRADKLRKKQATRVAQIVKDVRAAHRLPIVLGDLNEDWNSKTDLKPLADLVADDTLCDPFQGRAADAWTHFFEPQNETSRLDYVLLDGALKAAVSDATVFRKGLTLKCAAAGEHYPSMGYVGTEASDHCPVVVTLDP